MYEEPLLTTTVSVVLLLSISAIFVKKINFPYTVGLVIVGIALGFAASQVEILQPMQHGRDVSRDYSVRHPADLAL